MLVVRLGEGRDHLIWTHHHLLLDGWSTAREIEEIFAHYLGEPSEPVTGRYRDYIAWLARQDIEAAQCYWQEALRALEEPTLLADALSGGRSRRKTDGSSPSGHGQSNTRFSTAATERLARFAMQERITLNTLVPRRLAASAATLLRPEHRCFRSHRCWTPCRPPWLARHPWPLHQHPYR